MILVKHEVLYKTDHFTMVFKVKIIYDRNAKQGTEIIPLIIIIVRKLQAYCRTTYRNKCDNSAYSLPYYGKEPRTFKNILNLFYFDH